MIKVGFSEKVKLTVRKRAFFRCCICHEPFIEVHHIIPEAEGNDNSIENAAPLCARCHDLFGGNPDKRKRIKQMRDNWYEVMDNLRSNLTTNENFEEYLSIKEKPENFNTLITKKIAIYHVVFKDEDFEKSARVLFELVKSAQKSFPNYERLLYLDIENHRNCLGGFDNDMFELMRYFIMELLMQFLTEAHLPLAHIENKNLQRNDFPDDLILYDEEDPEGYMKKMKKFKGTKYQMDSYPKSI